MARTLPLSSNMMRESAGADRNHRKLYGILLVVALLAACASHPPGPPPGPSAPRHAPSPDPGRYRVMHKKYVGGINFYNKGDFDHAIRTLGEVWRWDPEYLNITMYLSRSYLLSGLEHYAEKQYAKAIELWNNVLIVDPKNGKARRYLVRASEELKSLQ